MFSPNFGAYPVTNGRLEEKTTKGDHRYFSSKIRGWNSCGYIPILRTVSGSLRATLGLFDVIAGIALSILTSNQEKLSIANIGIKNVFRGYVEVTGDLIFLHSPSPVLGTLYCLILPIYDYTKGNKEILIYEQ